MASQFERHFHDTRYVILAVHWKRFPPHIKDVMVLSLSHGVLYASYLFHLCPRALLQFPADDHCCRLLLFVISPPKINQSEQKYYKEKKGNRWRFISAQRILPGIISSTWTACSWRSDESITITPALIFEPWLRKPWTFHPLTVWLLMPECVREKNFISIRASGYV